MNTRDVGISVQTQKMVVVDEIAVKEELVYSNHSFLEKNIRIGTALYDSKNKKIKEENFFIVGDNYITLMGIDTSLFRIDKQENSFNENDIWVVIDKIRNDNVKNQTVQ